MSEYLSLFKNKSAESLFLEKYDLCLKQWPVINEAVYVETEFGLTHVIKCGNKKVVTKVDEVKERAERLIKNLTFRITDDASHTFVSDKPEIVNPVILDFLNDKNAGSY